MGAYHLLGDRVVNKGEFVELVPIELEGAAESGPLASLRAANPEASPGATQFVPIGPGLPLTILIRHVYTGTHPRTFWGGGRPMCVMTGLKDYAAFAPTSRAINFLEQGISPGHHFVAPSTFNGGTNVVAYSPAVVTDSFHFTVEIAFDRFPDELMQTIATGLTSLAGIPMMVPVQGALLAAGSILKIASDWADALIDGRATFSVTDTLDFNIPGSVPPSADFRLLCQPDFDPRGMTYMPGQGLKTGSGALYDGASPYVIVSLDGAVRKGLEKFSATVATAAQLRQFVAMRDGGEASVEALLSAFKLANDIKYRDEAKELIEQISAETVPNRKAEMERRVDALKKNILTAELKL
jgi:hypothetical protein